MKKEFDLEIKKMLSLVESKSGDVRPITRRTRREVILSEQVEAPDDRLKQLERNFDSILKRDKGSSAKILQSWGKLDNTIYNKIEKSCDDYGLVNPFNVGDRYAKVKFDAPNGSPTEYLVFAKEGPKPETLFGVELTDPEGLDKGPKSFRVVLIKFPSMFSDVKSRTSDGSNYSEPQIRLLNRFMKAGKDFTGYDFTNVMPKGDETSNWIAVDLATGLGKNGVKYIPDTMLNPSEIDRLFPERNTGKDFLWVQSIVKQTKMDHIKAVEKMLSQMGGSFTANEKKLDGPGDPRFQQGMLVTQFCSGGKCKDYDAVERYLNDVKTGRADEITLWPLVADYDKRQTSGKGGGRKARRFLKQLEKGYATPKSCKRALEISNTIISKNYSDAVALNAINGIADEVGINPSTNVIDGVNELNQHIRRCKDLQVNLNNKYTQMLNELGGKCHKWAYNQEEACAANAPDDSSPLSESISRSLRKVLKEHTKPNSDYMIKKSVRKNLRRLL